MQGSQSRLLRAGNSSGSGDAHPAALQRAASGDPGSQEIFVLPRQKSRSRDRRESRMFLVDGQLCWADDVAAAQAGLPPAGFSPGKRSSSIGMMFGSSMDLSGVGAYGQSIDSSGGAGSGSEEAISYRIKWCRENIMQLKRQTWPMEKKLQVLRASKMFIKQHQGELKQSKQAKDVIAGTSAIFERYWRHFRREMANFLVIITPWEMRIKKIESHFGSVVASYFTFLRWIFWLNLANSLVLCSFVMVPELIENSPDLTGMRKGDLGMERTGASAEDIPEFNPTLSEMWEFEGFLKSSPIFYGYYSNVEISKSGFWRNPLAFLMSAMLTYLFCFFCISRKLSQNTKMSRIGSKDDEYTFCWTVFVGWDFMIGNSETAYNKTSSLVMNLKEGILEEKEQTKDRDWALITRRVFANMLTIMLIVASAYVVTLAVQRSEKLPEDASLLQKNELQLVMSGIQFMFPPLFDVIGIIEKYHPRKALSWQLGRILFLDFLNFYTLMFSLFGTVDQMTQQLNELSGNITLFRQNTTYYEALFTTTTTTTTTTTPPSTTTIETVETNITSTSLTAVEFNTMIIIDSQNGSSAMNNVSTLTGLPGVANSSLLVPTATDHLNFSSGTTEYGRPTTGEPNATNLFSSSTLMASSTMMPSTMTTTTTSQILTASSSDSSISSTSISSSGSISTTSLPSTVRTDQPEDDLSTEPATERATTRQMSVTEMLTTTTEAAVSDDQRSTTTVASSDEDYPDIQNIFGKGSSDGRRRKRETKLPQDEIERDETILIDANLKTPDDTAGTNSRRQHKTTHQRLAGLPPIRDPYKKLGTNQQNQQTAKPIRTHESMASSNLMPAYPTYSGEDEDEEEEPLEGRLEIQHNSKQARRKGSDATSRRLSSGVARPIGGRQQSGRVASSGQSSTTTTTTTTTKMRPEDLNSDSDGDEGDQDSPEDQMRNANNDDGTGNALSTSNDVQTTFIEPTTSEDPSSKTSVSASKETDSTIESDAASSSSSQSGNSADQPTAGAGEDERDSLSRGNKATSRAGFSGGSSAYDENGSQESRATTSSGDASANNLLPSQLSNITSALQGERAKHTSINVTIINSNVTSIKQIVQSGNGSLSENGSYSELTDTPECAAIPEFKHQEILALNSTLKDKLKNLCWETMFGQEMVKMVVMDLVMTIVSAVSFEFMRACFVRYCNRFFFWDLERGFPGYQDFKIAENVLHLVNNQSTVWMGMFFAPGLPAINTVKLAVLMYVRSWAVLTCNIPHETVFKVSKSNNFYYWILLINLLICILPVAYAVTWIRPSWHCGPFGGECRMYLVVTKLVKQLLPPEANSVFRYVTSPGAVIPILIALILIIYYLASTVSSSKEANKELKAQLKKDKEQESAVPEITNTTVVDPAPAPLPAAATTTTTTSAIGPTAATVSQASSTVPPPLSQAAVSNPMAGPLLSAAAPTTSAGQTLVAGSNQDSKPKSLLMPPRI